MYLARMEPYCTMNGKNTSQGHSIHLSRIRTTRKGVDVKSGVHTFYPARIGTTREG
jgi:hypothetical protein